jgi:hypothetical protein
MKEEGRFEFGGPCPPIKSWFFPADPAVAPQEMKESEEEKGEKDGDPAQSA